MTPNIVEGTARKATGQGKLILCAWIAALCLTGCGKNKQSAEDAPIETVSSGAEGTVITTHLLGSASKLGFAAKVPSDVVLFVSALNLKSHLGNLEGTRFYQDAAAYLEDKTPAPSAEEPSKASTFVPVLGDDAFLAVGAGGEQLIGAASRMAEADSSGLVATLLGTLLPLPGQISSGAQSPAAFPAFTIPPVLIGIRSSDPAKALATLLPESARETLARLGKGAEMTLADGSRFTLHEGKLGTLLLGDTPPTGWSRLLHAAKDQPFAAAWGVSGDYALLALGSARKALEFASRPEDSVLAKNEWGFLADQVDESLIGLGWIDQSVLELSASRLRPARLLQTWLNSLPPDAAFGGLGGLLKDQINALAESESRWLDESWSAAAFGMWWQSGLRLEIMGGPVLEDVIESPGFQFTSQLEEPLVLYGLNTVVQPADQARFQAWIKDWGALLHAGTSHVLKRNAPATGEDNPLQKWFDTDVVPNVKAIHDGFQQVNTEGLGKERTWLIELPESAAASSEEGEKTNSPAQWPQFAQFASVSDRRALNRGWLAMESPLAQLARSIPSGLPPDSFIPEMVMQDGMNLYFLSMPIFTPQFSPCLIVGDEAMILSSTRLLGDRVTGSLNNARAKPGDPALSQWRLNVPLLRKWLQAGSPLAAPATASGAAAHWLAPFGDLRGRSTIKGGKLFRVWTWDISDPRRFD